MKKTSIQSGQILLLILLAGVIALTVGLAVASRIITTNRASVSAQQSQQALAAAEAGVQLAINKNGSVSVPTTLQGSAKILSVSSTAVSGRTFLLNGGGTLGANEGTDLWLVPHTTGGIPNLTVAPYTGTITFDWAATPVKDDTGSTISYTCVTPNPTNSSVHPIPAMEFIVFEDPSAAPSANNAVVSYFVFDSCSRNNKFSSASTTGGQIGGINMQWTTGGTVVVKNAYLIKVIPIYNNSVVGIFNATGGNIPSQGTTYVSTGVSGNTQRTINVFRGYPTTPGLFGIYQR